MAQQTIKVHLHMQFDCDWSNDDYQKKWRPRLLPYKGNDSVDRIYAGERLIDVDVPDNFDPTAKVIGCLEAQKLEALAEYQKTVADLNRRISELQAIEYTPA